MVTHLHKKNSNLAKENYRPDSILPVFKRFMKEELMNSRFLVSISVFRTGYNRCQSTLLRIHVIEDWKQAFIGNKYV